MKEFDFIFIYEHKVRELENLCLLKVELESRGYSVLLKCYLEMEFFQYQKPEYHAKVLGIFACYNNLTLRICVRQLIKFDKLVDFQWEQSISKEQESSGSFRNFTEIGRDAVHISWGKANYFRLKDVAGIREENLKLCGNIAMDFVQPEFYGYYSSREEILAKYHIDDKKKICMFFANFKSTGFSEEELEELRQKFGEGRMAMHQVAVKSQKKILEWVEKLVIHNPDIVFIYRPHPGEKCDEARKLEEKYSGFRVISDYSVRQWIMIADVLFSWHSTVMVEAYYAGKNCYHLEPYQIPEEQKARIYDSIHPVQSYDVFESIVKGRPYDLNISDQLMDDYYGYDKSRFSFLRMADALEEVFVDDGYFMTDAVKRERIYQRKNGGIKDAVWRIGVVNAAYWFIIKKYYDKMKKYKVFEKKIGWYGERLELIRENVATNDEMRHTEEKVKAVWRELFRAE